jgi:DUF4097 and DUF4098 domain-containing protein YvlB
MFHFASSRRVRRDIALAMAPLPFVVMSGCAAVMASLVKAERAESRSFAVGARPAVVVDTFNGEIGVEKASGGKVEAVVTRTGSGANPQAAEADLENVKVEYSQEGDTVRIVATRTGPKNFGSSGASVALKVPVEATLSLTTRNGEVHAEGVVGDIMVRSSNGRIEVAGGRGKLDLRTSNGGIEIEAQDAVVSAETSNGNVSFAGSLVKGSHSLETSNGGIALRLPAAAAFRFDARTSNGSVTNRFPALQPTSGKTGSRKLGGVVGQAEASGVDVKLETSNGKIAIEPLQLAEAPGR